MATIFESGRDFWVALVGIVLFGGWIIPAVAGIIAKNWRKARESEHLAVLKQSMIERGMSVEEMERVIDMGTVLKQSMIERGMSVEEMERIFNLGRMPKVTSADKDS